MWEQVKWAREVCVSVRVRGENTKSVWWNSEAKTTVRRKEVFAARDKESKRFMEAYRKEKRKVYISEQKESKLTVWKEDE